jgi:pimeloyl-ACP methyl ester carboxylesterase
MPTKMVLIHGAFVNASSWANFVPFFQDRGYAVVIPEWPCRAPDALPGLGVKEIVDHYHELIHEWPDPPVIVGHSFGGLFAEILLDRGFGLAGVALDPAPPRGVLRLAYSELKVASPALAHPSKRSGVIELTPEQFHYGFTNTFSPAAADEAYRLYNVPETGRIFYQDAFANLEFHSPVEVDYGKSDRAPLLITAGGEDHTVPAAVSRAAYEKYAKHSKARTDFVEFPDMPHLLMAAPGWKQVAEYVAAWLEQVLPPEAVPARATAARG